MLGDLIFEQQGKTTSRRVLDEQTMEISFDAKIKIKGVDGMNMGSYTSKMMPDGAMYGQGVGCVMTSDGQMVTWKGTGIGRFVSQNKVRYTGALFLSTQSKGSLASLNNMAVVFEHDGDMEGNLSAKGWEWK